MIDQHALTGESTPAEKGVGDRVFASTLMVARQDPRLGREVGQRDRLGQDQPDPQRHGRLQAELAAQGGASGRQGGDSHPDRRRPGHGHDGPGGAVAVLNSDFGTGIRMAAPLAMLTSLALCASKGILVKDGRALELMNEVDTVLFDKTGTLTRERPEVGRVIAAAGHTPRARSCCYAAAAERKFHHPIALAILHKAEELNLELPSDRRHAVQGRLRDHGPDQRADDPGRQQAVHGARGAAHRVRRSRMPSRKPTGRANHGDGRRGRPGRRGHRAGRLGSPRGPRHRQGTAGPGHHAHRDHLGRSRGPDQEAGRVAGNGPLLRPGSARPTRPIT